MTCNIIAIHCSQGKIIKDTLPLALGYTKDDDSKFTWDNTYYLLHQQVLHYQCQCKWIYHH